MRASTSGNGIKRRLLASAAALLAVTAMATPAASAADNVTQIRLYYNGSCEGGQRQLTLSFDGNPAGSYNANNFDCTCSSAERSFVINDPALLAAVGPKGCTTARVDITGAGYYIYTRVEVDRAQSGTETICIDDVGGHNCAPRQCWCCGDNYAYLGNTTFTAQLSDVDRDGTPDCNDPDIDGDGILNAQDNCRSNANADQLDTDGDTVGDACDNCPGVASPDASDTDGDGLGNVCDNCPGVANVTQADCNHNGTGDVCEVNVANQDPDQDGLCSGNDNCPNVANADQIDCNGNGTGNLCEPSWANRDDDGDGKCNGIDNCALESNAGQEDANHNGIGDLCEMQAITVPWVPSNTNLPHSTYSGASITLKGIARYGGNQFMWDFGDGTPATAWTAIGDAWNLGVKHTYNGSVGQIFVATLSVRNNGAPNVVATATYPVKIQLSADLHNRDEMDVRVNMAIDEGLWWLHTNMSRGQYGEGSPGYAQPYGLWAGNNAHSCAAVDAFLLHGSKPNKSYATDPYVEDAIRGLNYMLAGASAVGITAQQYGNPDFNGNGVGVYFSSNDTYQDGICATTFGSSNTPGRQSLVGAYPSIYGQSYKAIGQDVIEWFAYGQTDGTGPQRGGWLYNANSGGADGSTNQWPILGMTAIESSLGATVPAFVRQEIPHFINYSRHAGLDNDNGGWGYSGPDEIVNSAKTAAGMLAHDFQGDSNNHPDVLSGLGFLYRHWNVSDHGWSPGNGNSYTMYGIMKAMVRPQPQIERIVDFDYNNNVQTNDSFDWYYTPVGQQQEGLASYLVTNQNADGQWNQTDGYNAGSVQGALGTAWNVMILQKAVTSIPPTASICDCQNSVWLNDQNIVVDGSCSSHGDLNRSIAKYEWDFDFNGSFVADGSGASYTLVGGYPQAGDHVVALRVTDDNPLGLGGPQSAITTCTVKVKSGAICPHPDAGGPYLGSPNVSLQFDGSASFDPNGDPLTYEWDLDNDGLFGADDHSCFGQLSDGVGVNPTAKFPTPITGTVAVRVTDHPDQNVKPTHDAPCAVVAFATVEIGNHAPVSDPAGPYAVKPGGSITLSNNSSDPDGDAITYAWDLTGNGLFNDSALKKPVFTAPANAPIGASYSVCLKVTDVFGKSDVACATVTVAKANTAPTCVILTPTVAASCTGGDLPIAIDASNSTDADGDAITFSWTTNCDGAFNDAALAMTTLTVNTAHQGCVANCAAHLVVSDGQLSTSCDATVAITDYGAPVFDQVPVDESVECDANTAGKLSAWLISAHASDVCSSVGVGSNYDGSLNGPGKTGVVGVVWSAVDDCSNEAKVKAKFSITDSKAPVVTCPADVAVECDSGHGTASVTPAGGSAKDLCAGNLPAQGPGAGEFPVGATAITYTATDPSGNAGQCIAQVVVKDTAAPVIVCPAPQQAECTGNGEAMVSPDQALGSDICVGAPTVQNAAPGLFPVGTTTTNYLAIDGNGNTASCTSSVTVADTQKPIISCPAPVTVECTANGSAQVSPASALASDVCTTPSVDNAAAGSFPLGTTTTQYAATDRAGNRSECTSSVKVVDTTKPSITCPAPQTVECTNDGQATITPAFASATDSCTSATVTNAPTASFPLGTTVTSYSAVDKDGNKVTCGSSITVVDTKGPELPGDVGKTFYEDEKYFEAQEQLWEYCLEDDSAVMPFKLSDCFPTRPKDKCSGTLDPDKAGEIIRVEWWGYLRAGDDDDDHCEGRKHGRHNNHDNRLGALQQKFDRQGCGQFHIANSAMVYLPFEELDDVNDDAGSFYKVVYKLKDLQGNTTEGVCRVNIASTHQKEDDYEGRCKKDKNNVRNEVGPVVCIGNGCDPKAPTKALACPNTSKDCTKLAADCLKKGVNSDSCDAYNEECTTIPCVDEKDKCDKTGKCADYKTCQQKCAVFQ